LPDVCDGVLITRPEPGAGETASRVAALGLQPIVAPLLTITLRRTSLPPSGRVQAILVTSGNAIPAIPASHRHLPLFAVGAATAQRARASGFDRVSSADGDSDALAALVGERCDPSAGPLLLAAGHGQGHMLAGHLRQRGFRVQRRVVYIATPAQSLPGVAHAALATSSLTAALFFSAETAQAFVRLIELARLHETVRQVDALAIGRPAAVALQALPWRRIRVAAQPNQDAMLELLR
jgi:uroporphyrinogen-III synthase